MDWLTELVEAMARALGGEQTPPEKNAPEGGRSLEEILEQVREQARRKEAQRTGSAQPAPQQRPVQPQRSAEPPRPKRAPLVPVEEEQVFKYKPLEEQAAAETKVRTVEARAEVESQVRTVQSRAGVETPPEQMAPHGAAPKVAFAKDAKAARRRQAERPSPPPAPVAGQRIFEVLRTAPPAARLQAARQAMIALEVFGPPRALRPHRPGYFAGRR